MHIKAISSSIILIIVLCFLSQPTFAQGYKIEIHIKGIQDTTVILGHYLNKSMYPDDTVKLDNAGRGIFKGKKAFKEGLYVLFLPGSRYFEIIMGNDQEFLIETDTVDFVKNLVVKGSLENEIFSDFQRYMIAIRPKMENLNDKFKQAETDADKNKIRSEIQEINIERIAKIKKTNQEHPELFVSVFLKATLDIEIPEAPKLSNGKIDSTFQYRYYKTHFFENFDPGDVRLLYTPLYEDKIMYYLDKVIPQIPDSLNIAVDYLITKSRSDSALFRYMLITLFNYYGKSNIMGMDAVQVHIADQYYLKEAWWSDNKFITDLVERVAIMKPLLIGQTAPNVQLLVVPKEHFLLAEADTGIKRYPHAGELKYISDFRAEYTVLIFWEANCSHCKKSVPELYKIYEESLKQMGVEVIAISTLFGTDGKEKWVDFVNANKLYDWVNAWNPYDYKYKVIYDVRSTPQIFVLDKYKKIIGKHLGSENVLELIQAYKKMYPTIND